MEVNSQRETRWRFALIFLFALFIHLFTMVPMNRLNSQHAQEGNTILLDTIIDAQGAGAGTFSTESPSKHVRLKNSDPVMVVTPEIREDGTTGITVISEKGLPFSFLIEDTHLPFSLSANGEPAAQNFSPQEPLYTSNRAYVVTTFTHNAFQKTGDTYRLSLEITGAYEKGSGEKSPYFLLASPGALNSYLRYRLMIASLMFGGYILIILISLALYIRYRANRSLLILLLSTASTYAFLLLGEYPALRSLQDLPAGIMDAQDSIAFLVIFYLILILAISLLRSDLNIRKRALLLSAFMILTLLALISGNLMILTSIQLAGTLLIYYLTASARGEFRSYSYLIAGVYSLLSASVLYQRFITAGWVTRGFPSEIGLTQELGLFLFLATVTYTFVMANTRRLSELMQRQHTWEKTSLLKGIAHDLKLPLSVIKLKAQLSGLYPHKDRSELNVDADILAATGDLEEMTENINAYLYAIDETPRKESCSVLEQLSSLSRRYAHYGDQRGITFSSSIEEKDCTISVSPVQFSRMIGNVLHNAFSYNRDNGSVTLSYILGRKAVITIEDTGFGMSEEVLAHVHEPFFRADTRGNLTGSGLGLSVVKTIADNLEAEISIKSTAGAGTVIRFFIPY